MRRISIQGAELSAVPFNDTLLLRDTTSCRKHFRCSAASSSSSSEQQACNDRVPGGGWPACSSNCVECSTIEQANPEPTNILENGGFSIIKSHPAWHKGWRIYAKITSCFSDGPALHRVVDGPRGLCVQPLEKCPRRCAEAACTDPRPRPCPSSPWARRRCGGGITKDHTSERGSGKGSRVCHESQVIYYRLVGRRRRFDGTRVCSTEGDQLYRCSSIRTLWRVSGRTLVVDVHVNDEENPL